MTFSNRSLLLLALVFVCSCSTKKVEEKEIPISPLSEELNLFKPDDEYSYVGYVYPFYFEKTDEFYVELYFKKDNISDDEYSSLTKSGDSILYRDDENCRTRIPLDIAIQKLDFRGMKTLSLFDKNNSFLTRANFVRVEYLDQNISPVFIAVYKADQPKLIKKAVYCIGNLKDAIVETNYQFFEDTLLTKGIEKKMGFTHQYNLEGMHYTFDGKGTLSIINLDTTSAIVLKNTDTYKLIYQEKMYNEYITDALLLPIKRNSHPIILMTLNTPDTDVIWSELLTFDGEKYQKENRQRLKH